MGKLKQIDIAQLRVGMFVADMDIPWLQSPFLRHRCLIKTDKDIRLIEQAGARRITIDLDKGKDVAAESAAPIDAADVPTNPPPSTTASPTATPAPAAVAAPGAPAPAPRVSVSAELGAARAAREQTEARLGEAFADWDRGQLTLNEDLMSALEETSASLARNDQALLRLLAEARREPSLVTHSFATFTLISALLKQHDASEADVTEVGLAAILHDVGWMRLPRNLLLKHTSFNPGEHKLALRHVETLMDMLKGGTPVSERVRIWLQAHETEIPGAEALRMGLNDDDRSLLDALRVVDKYDELCAGIMGCTARTPNAALALLYRQAQSGSLSTEWVQRLIHLIGVYPLGSAVLLSNQEKGIVAEIHRDRPLQPIVEVRYNRLGQPLMTATRRDLSKATGDDALRILNAIDPGDPRQDPAGILRA